MALSSEDIRQIVDALEQLDWVVFVKQQLQASVGASQARPAEALPPAAATQHYSRDGGAWSSLSERDAQGGRAEAARRELGNREIADPNTRGQLDVDGSEELAEIREYALANNVDWDTARIALRKKKPKTYAGAMPEEKEEACA